VRNKMVLMGLSMIAALYASRLSGEPSRTGDHYEGMVSQDHLACIDRADAVRFVHFYRSDEFPTFENVPPQDAGIRPLRLVAQG
jgi:hypothetical protein